VTNEKLDQILYPLVYAGDVGLPGVAGNNRYAQNLSTTPLVHYLDESDCSPQSMKQGDPFYFAFHIVMSIYNAIHSRLDWNQFPSRACLILMINHENLK
jgi:hypothetical protein